MRRPRMRDSSTSPRVARSWPSKRIRPPRTRPAGPRYRMTESTTVDFPQPDSPTRPSASPRPSVRLSFGTTLSSPARRRYEIRTSWNSRRAGGRGADSVTQVDLAEPDREQVEPDHQGGDGDARDQRHVRPYRHHPVGVLHHAAPVRIGRRKPDAEEA